MKSIEVIIDLLYKDCLEVHVPEGYRIDVEGIMKRYHNGGYEVEADEENNTARFCFENEIDFGCINIFSSGYGLPDFIKPEDGNNGITVKFIIM